MVTLDLRSVCNGSSEVDVFLVSFLQMNSQFVSNVEYDEFATNLHEIKFLCWMNEKYAHMYDNSLFSKTRAMARQPPF